MNRKTAEIDPPATVYQDGSTTPQTVSPTTSYAYNSAGNLASVTDSNGNKSSYTYDLEGRRLSTISPFVVPASAGSAWELPAEAGTTNGAPAEAGTTSRLLTVPGLGQVICAGGPITSWGYDYNGNVTSTTDEARKRTPR